MGRRTLLAAAVLLGTGEWALPATSWSQPTQSVTITTHFTATDQARSGSAVLTLDHDGPVTIRASVVRAGDQVLTAAGGDTLATSYKLTGSALGGSADANWVASSAFIAPEKFYSVEGTGPSDLTLSVRGQTSPSRANDAGAYAASVVLTVTW